MLETQKFKFETFIKPLLVGFGFMWCISVGAQVQNGLDLKSEIQPFAIQSNKEFGIDIGRVEEILAQARIDEGVLASIQRPAESLLWKDYRKIFMTQSRIAKGAEFWKQHAAILKAAESKFGVPQEIIVAIIGVETLYGKHKGKIRVLDALATLGFRYPKRGKFFLSELKHFFQLVESEHLDPLLIKGSYAGAMGIPQFISSSYRNYAIDFDNDGVRDLLHSEADAIGSVASYLGRHGWRAGGVIADKVILKPGTDHETIQSQGLKPHTQLSKLKSAGVNVPSMYKEDLLAAMIVLQASEGQQFWLGYNNFYVITRYNHSHLYAMAVFQLAQAVKAHFLATGG